MPRRYLNLSVLWQDADLLELEIRASSGDFAGSTRVYTTEHALRSFSAALSGFPRSNTDRCRFDARTPDTCAVLEFHCVNGAGHVAIRVELTAESPHLATLTQDTAGFEIFVGGCNLRGFAAQVAQLASGRIDSVELFPDD